MFYNLNFTKVHNVKVKYLNSSEAMEEKLNEKIICRCIVSFVPITKSKGIQYLHYEMLITSIFIVFV